MAHNIHAHAVHASCQASAPSSRLRHMLRSFLSKAPPPHPRPSHPSRSPYSRLRLRIPSGGGRSAPPPASLPAMTCSSLARRVAARFFSRKVITKARRTMSSAKLPMRAPAVLKRRMKVMSKGCPRSEKERLPERGPPQPRVEKARMPAAWPTTRSRKAVCVRWSLRFQKGWESARGVIPAPGGRPVCASWDMIKMRKKCE
mmetsp:Transcript_49371/g.164810  ORF Transcript_49371/g.164810 Transcript_49371/m.164810 type:complete len:201 (-) Transcript_49371:550-1152(-)